MTGATKAYNINKQTENEIMLCWWINVIKTYFIINMLRVSASESASALSHHHSHSLAVGAGNDSSWNFYVREEL
jgi:hypothetical protein